VSKHRSTIVAVAEADDNPANAAGGIVAAAVAAAAVAVAGTVL